MREVQQSISIHASKEDVWDIVFNKFGHVNDFNPLIEGSHFLNGENGFVGCERQCAIDSKTMVQERITRAEAGLNFDIEIFEGGLPMMDKMTARFDLVELSSDKTEVLFTMSYSTKPAFMGGLMKGKMAKFFMKLLIGLKYHLETGELVSKQNIREIEKQFKSLEAGASFEASMQLVS
ncbi:MAG: SRPBCC family protein [Roseivirga sp.]|nr:SRPBCC family protein [Roseivirga sp.]